ncbi:nephrin-like, partial [Amphibalanus amphitrite]|uniref:nephrin-like n=1 Tax=Amphibalanus amphitrite TaxID=1232801 RepID=UPI001C918396
YSRKLPGYPRYRLLGDPAAGVHDLEITNVTLEDDGRFQCQVSPSGGQPAIRADAYLSVILKPQSVRLRAFVDGVATYDEVQVPRGESVTLTCDVTGARPAAGIEWQRNGRHLEAGGWAGRSNYHRMLPTTHATADRADGSAVVLAAVGDARRLDTRSSLTVDAGRADDGAGYSCVARHPALRPADGHRERFNASITFSVLYPPGPPSISGYSAGEILRTGEQRTLTCSSKGGNPPARLVWTRNGRAVGQVYRAGRRAATAAHTFIADPTDLGAVYRCTASSKVYPEPMAAQVEIDVYFAPKRVSVTAPASAQSGDVIHVSCVTSESNPPANLTWIVSDGVLENATWAAHPAPDGGWISSSNVTALVPADADQQFPLRCFAQNPAVPQPRDGTALVTVLQAPQPPTILGYAPDEVLQAGERVTLSCLVRGGNPRPRLSWLSGARPLESRQQQAGRDTLSLLTLTVSAEDNGRRLTCRSRSDAADRPSDASATLRVSFPPSRLDISVSPSPLRAGQPGELTCESRPSLPAARLSWWSGGRPVTEHVVREDTVPTGQHGGFVSRSVLRKSLSWTDDGAELVCKAEMPALTGTLQTVRKLHVQHAPVFERPQLNATAVRGQPLSLNLTARANPPVRDYVWSRADGAGASADERLLTSADGRLLTSVDGVLNLTSVRREDAGWYLLRATSALGSASARVHVDVLYPPKVFKTPSIITAARHGRLDLPCRAEANPLSGGMFSWSRPGQRQPLNLTSSYLNGTSFLRIPALTEDSAGDFVCSVTNDLGLDSATFTVVIQEPAKIAKSVRFAKAAARLGEKAHVTCRARGAPAVTFSWSRDGDVISGTGSGGKYGTERKQCWSVLRWASVLVIIDITESDYGEYECRASNRLGSDTHRVRLVEPSAPDPPRDLHVLNVSSGAVTLAWTPAFDGGFIQGFRFRYSEWESGEETVRDGDPNSARFTVGGLRADAQYTFRVAGYNQLGVGAYTEPPLVVRTSGTPPVGYVTDREDSEDRLPYPRLLVGAASLCGIVFLVVLNAVLISCCHFHRKQSLRHAAARSEAGRPAASAAPGDPDGTSSLSARSARSNSIGDSIDKPEDCRLLPDTERGPFPTITVVQPEGPGEVELMTLPDLPPRRDGSPDGDDSYGYSHLRTPTPFRDALADSVPPSVPPDVTVTAASEVPLTLSRGQPRPTAGGSGRPVTPRWSDSQ